METAQLQLAQIQRGESQTESSKPKSSKTDSKQNESGVDLKLMEQKDVPSSAPNLDLVNNDLA